NMLVANALDIVLAIAIAQHRRTLGGLHGSNLGAMHRFQPVARCDRPGGACRRYKGRQPRVRVRSLQMRKDTVEGMRGAMIMNEIVGKFRELIEDDVLLVARELCALVVDFLDVAFGAGRADDVGWICYPLLKPVEPLATHSRRQHSHTATAQNS